MYAKCRGYHATARRWQSRNALHAAAIVVHVVATDAGGLRAFHFADLVVRAGHRLGIDHRFVLERMGFIRVAVIAIQRPIQARGAGRAKHQQE